MRDSHPLEVNRAATASAVVEPAPDVALRDAVEELADQLCMVVDGKFDFTVRTSYRDDTVEKLQMLVNFVLDAARRGLRSLEDEKRRLEEIDKLKSDFLANVSHELRTPLTLILGPLETILARTELPADLFEDLECVHRNAARLLVLVNDLLDFSKAEAGKLEPDWCAVDLARLLTQAVDDFRPAATAKGVSLTLEIDPSECTVLLDPKLVEKIVLNLVGNALKFTPESGRITVRLSSRKGEDLELQVADTGPGIPIEKQAILFKRFEQLCGTSTRTQGGTGLGLALVKEFAELLEGTVAVESSPGNGARFIVHLPWKRPEALPIEHGSETRVEKQLATLARPRRLAVADSGRRLSAAPRVEVLDRERSPGVKRLRVLVADDNPELRGFIANLLAEDYEVATATNGREALQLAETSHPDVIVSDVMMPEMDGLELVARLKENPTLRHVPVILVTARASREEVVGGLESGADDYLSKPFGPAELQARLRAVCRLKKIYEELSRHEQEAAHASGMAMIASEVLHNVGNVLNSAFIATEEIESTVRESKISGLDRSNQLLASHREDIGSFLTLDEKGKKLPEYWLRVTEALRTEHSRILGAASRLQQGLDLMKKVISAQQKFAIRSQQREALSLEEAVEDALHIQIESRSRHNIKVTKAFSQVPLVIADRIKLAHIFVNILRNAKDAVAANDPDDRRLHVEIGRIEREGIFVRFTDNGSGIREEDRRELFSRGFTTKPSGHGLGLHFAANAMTELGGRIEAESRGLGQGASFTLYFPDPPDTRG